MSLFIETIRLKSGLLRNLPFHQERFERTRRARLGLQHHPLLEQALEIPGGLESGLFKCRVIYGSQIERVEYEPYLRPVITSLKLVRSDTVAYAYKEADRTLLDTLFRSRGDADDILIVKDGLLTDSYYANITLWDGRSWHTPDTPLLKGTMRAFLLRQGVLSEKHLHVEDLKSYRVIRLINALNPLEEAPEIHVRCIRQ